MKPQATMLSTATNPPAGNGSATGLFSYNRFPSARSVRDCPIVRDETPKDGMLLAGYKPLMRNRTGAISGQANVILSRTLSN